jgi:small-conductance mechanosensitive channel
MSTISGEFFMKKTGIWLILALMVAAVSASWAQGVPAQVPAQQAKHEHLQKIVVLQREKMTLLKEKYAMWKKAAAQQQHNVAKAIAVEKARVLQSKPAYAVKQAFQRGTRQKTEQQSTWKHECPYTQGQPQECCSPLDTAKCQHQQKQEVLTGNGCCAAREHAGNDCCQQ